jgi:diacylglycerol diphosphate phosphatase/phosphatidate phosphatase
VCTGDRKRINNALISFPSGHATIAFAGFTYLSIYLNAKLKLFSDHQPAYWVLVLAYIPILAATLLSGTLILGQHHHPHDVVAGAIIGAAMAVSSFRAVYAGVWDYRVNHIPLRRRVGFRYCYGADRAIETFGDVVFTRSAGWGKGIGSETIVRGAPGDILFGGGEKGTGLGMGEMGYHRGSGARNGVGGVDRRAGPSETNGRKAEDMV